MTPQDPIYSLPTTVGANKLAYAMANQLTVDISHMAIGDGNGVAVNPTAAWSALAREVHRAQLNQLYQHPTNPNWLVAELVLPAEVGGWTIREIALYDVAGDLIFIGNHAEQYKPVQSQGSDETKTIRMVILVSSTAAVTLKTDPTTVMATVDYVQRELAKLDAKQSVRYTTTAAIGLAGLAVQAGGDWAGALTSGDRVLVKNQAAGKDNGIYAAAAGAWLRVADADGSVEVTSGLVVAVEQGATLADTRWQLVTDGAIVLGTTALVFQNVTQGFAPLSSPAFLDNPTAPTPPQFDNDLSLATTAFVQRAAGNKRAWVGINANTALTASHVGAAIGYLTGAAVTATLPAASGLAIGSAISFYNNTSVDQLVAAAGADTIAFGSTANGGAVGGSFTIPAGSTATLLAISGASWHVVDGTATLSGTKQPTPGQFDNDSSLATTEFVQRALGNAAGQVSKSTSSTIPISEAGCLINLIAGALVTTLPTLSSLPAGATFKFICTGQAGAVVQRNGTDTMSANGSIQTSFTLGLGDTLEVVAGGGTMWFVTGGTAQLKYSVSFGTSRTANGYQKLPSGVIEQWGSFAVPASATGAVSAGAAWEFTLPTTFPGGAFQVVASFANPNAGNTGAEISGNKIYLKNSHTAAQTVRWMAKGE